MDAYMIRVSGGYVPASPVDEESLSGIKVGQVVRCKISRARNGGHHRKFFALMSVVLSNTDRFDHIDALLTEVKLVTGHYQEHVRLSGELVLVPKSISFASMGQDEFEDFYKRTVDWVLQDLMQGMEEDELDRAVNQVMGFL